MRRKMRKQAGSSELIVNCQNNKRGQDKLISVYWFFILLIVAGGVVMMVNTFYSSPYDVREFEAQILAENVADCIYPGGQMNPFLNSNGVFRPEFKDNFAERCRLNFAPSREFDEIEYYVSAIFYEGGNEKSPRLTLEEGNLNYKSDCKIKDAAGKNLAVCVEKSIWVVNPNEKLYSVDILSVVRKVSEND
jgi:hypothetical protein